jgi:hypothetical protein
VKRTNLVVVLTCFVLACVSLSQAQQKEETSAIGIPPAGLVYMASAAPDAAVAAESPSPDPTAPADPGPPQGGTASSHKAADDEWHFSISPYLWLPGVHGTIGDSNHDISFRASAGDLLSHFRFGLLGFADARRNRLLVPIDIMFLRLGDNKALPFPGFGENSADLTANMFIFTPKLGVRVVDGKMMKIDAMAGIRYWHFHEDVSFTPIAPNVNFSKSQSWVDPIVGGRIITALSPKAEVAIGGDVGGWGTGSQLEYQVGGILSFKVKPNLSLDAGYRYLYFDKNFGSNNGNINTAMSGVILGATMTLK